MGASICLLLLPVLLYSKQVQSQKSATYWSAIASGNGNEKIKWLNKLAGFYISTENYHPDSALFYAKQSLELAQHSGDTELYSRSAGLCANISLQLSLVNQGLAYYQLKGRLALQMHDRSLLSEAIRGTAQALWYSGKFSQAIDSMKKALRLFEELQLHRNFSDGMMMMSSIYSDMGNYEKALEVAQQSLQLNKKSGDVANVILSLVQLGYLYKSVGDYSTAMKYFTWAAGYNPPPMEWCYRHLSNRIGELYLEKGNYDSAYYFYNRSLSSHSESKTSLLRMADYWLARQQFDKAKFYYNKVYRGLRNTGEGNLLVLALIGLGKSATGEKDFEKALEHGYEALQFARQRDTRITLRDAYKLLYTAYEAVNRPDSAFAYYKNFVVEKDAIVSDQFKGKLYSYKQASEMQLLANQKLLAEQRLKGDSMLRNILFGGIVSLLVLGAIIFWNISLKRKNEKLRYNQEQTALKQRAAEMEMQALRAQMNPHFIFNALSSINRFILKNDPEKASDYLTRFSRLIRLVLINSQRELILLEEELEMLRLYLQMEQLRFKHAFEFTIHLEDDIDPPAVMIPPMLLQPFCENAIWHGLMHGEAGGRLEINFELKNGFLNCTISDNGIGRQKAMELASKSAEKIKSLGLQLTKDRLAIFNQDQNTDASYEIEDLVNDDGTSGGTRVRLHIRCHTYVQSKKTQAVC